MFMKVLKIIGNFCVDVFGFLVGLFLLIIALLSVWCFMLTQKK